MAYRSAHLQLIHFFVLVENCSNSKKLHVTENTGHLPVNEGEFRSFEKVVRPEGALWRRENDTDAEKVANPNEKVSKLETLMFLLKSSQSL